MMNGQKNIKLCVASACIERTLHETEKSDTIQFHCAQVLLYFNPLKHRILRKNKSLEARIFVLVVIWY